MVCTFVIEFIYHPNNVTYGDYASPHAYKIISNKHEYENGNYAYLQLIEENITLLFSGLQIEFFCSSIIDSQ